MNGSALICIVIPLAPCEVRVLRKEVCRPIARAAGRSGYIERISTIESERLKSVNVGVKSKQRSLPTVKRIGIGAGRG